MYDAQIFMLAELKTSLRCRQSADLYTVDPLTAISTLQTIRRIYALRLAAIRLLRSLVINRRFELSYCYLGGDGHIQTAQTVTGRHGHMSCMTVCSWSLLHCCDERAVTLERGPSAHAPWWAVAPLLGRDPQTMCHRCTRPWNWVTDWFEHASPGIALALRRSAQRRLRRGATRSADRAGLGVAEHRPAVAIHGGLCRRRWRPSSARPGGSSPTSSSATRRWCWSGWNCTPSYR